MNDAFHKLRLSCFQAVCATVALLAILAFFTQPIFCQTAGDEETQEACQKFVQAFYDWYLSKDGASGTDAVLKRKANLLSSELYRRLKEDRDASEKCEGEICGLDFDPFLNSQDPSAHFKVGTVTRKGSAFWVDVYGVDSGRRQEHIIPELIQQNGRWVFVNFHYGKNKWTEDSNLLKMLKQSQADREKNP